MTEIQRITPSDVDWPIAIEQVDDPPSSLWLRGNRELLDLFEHKIAIVGSRAPTPYGEAQARRFASNFVRCDVTVISGLARGIDSAAHMAALEAEGRSIAVLGSGVDVPWPKGPVTDAMLAGGLVLSEFPPGVGPRRHHFPLRNRIIAAMADAVLVVEAAERSGSLITARWAMQLGVTVFALPGRVDHPMARGCLDLIRDGATPVGSPEQLIDDLYELGFGTELQQDPGANGVDHDTLQRPSASMGLTSELLAALVGETLTAADLSGRLGTALGEVLAGLMGLELEGRIRRSPGGLFSLTSELGR